MTSPPIASPTLWTHHLSRHWRDSSPRTGGPLHAYPSGTCIHLVPTSGGLGDRLATYPTPTAVVRPPRWARLASSVNGKHAAAVAVQRRFPVVAAQRVARPCRGHGPDTPRELPSEQLSAAATALHLNMYRSFDYTDRDTVYDSLALSVDGNLWIRSTKKSSPPW